MTRFDFDILPPQFNSPSIYWQGGGYAIVHRGWIIWHIRVPGGPFSYHRAANIVRTRSEEGWWWR